MNKIKGFLKNNYKDIIKDIVIIAIFFLLLFIDLPYVIYKPGGIINVSDRITIDGIDYEEEGSYNMSYVSSVKANIPNFLASFVIKDWERVKISDITYEDTSYEETFKIERYQLQNAIDHAIIVAYNKAGKEISIGSKKLIIAGLDDNAKTDLMLVDEVIKIDDITLEDTNNIKEYINNKEVGDKITLTVIREDEEITCTAEIYESEGSNVIGIYVYEDYNYTVNPNITVTKGASEAGSSGGLMTALAIYDSLIEEDLTHGKVVVGTGTISSDGTVGEIGGVKYKLLGAEKAGADIFFVPKENYKEAKEIYDEYDLSFKLIKVETFDDAIEYLNSIK